MDVPPPDGADSAEMSSATAAPHPEEMTGTIRLAMGDFATFTISGRATPAGLICAGIFLCGGLYEKEARGCLEAEWTPLS